MTTLAAALTNSATEMRVNAADADPAEYYTIDSEVIRVLANSTTVQDGLSPERSVDTTLWQIQRGHGPTAAASHLSGATLTPFPGVGGGAAEEGTVVEQLTGTQTTYGHFYRGDEDPEVDFSAELEPGDLWLDTTIVTGWPFVQKVRNAANDGWDFAGLVFTEDGKVRGVFRLEADTPDGATLTMGVYDENEVVLGHVGIVRDGSVAMVRSIGGVAFSSVELGVDGSINLTRDNAHLNINADESAEFTAYAGLHFVGPDLRVTDLPTSDPGVGGKLWKDAGVLKITEDA